MDGKAGTSNDSAACISSKARERCPRRRIHVHQVDTNPDCAPRGHPPGEALGLVPIEAPGPSPVIKDCRPQMGDSSTDLQVASVGPIRGPSNGMLNEAQTDAVAVAKALLAMYDPAAQRDLVFH